MAFYSACLKSIFDHAEPNKNISSSLNLTLHVMSADENSNCLLHAQQIWITTSIAQFSTALWKFRFGEQNHFPPHTHTSLSTQNSQWFLLKSNMFGLMQLACSTTPPPTLLHFTHSFQRYMCALANQADKAQPHLLTCSATLHISFSASQAAHLAS